MRPLYRKILPTPDSSFTVREYRIPYFDVPWHAHPEYEIILVSKSSGTRYVGDSIEPFEAGDLALLGAHLPHCWLNHPLKDIEGKQFDVEYMVVHFHHQFLGGGFFQKPELSGIAQLLQQASQGVLFEGDGREELAEKLRELPHLDPLKRLITLIETLRLMTLHPEKRLLSSAGFMQPAAENQDRSMDIIHRYVLEHFKQNIALPDIAQAVNMTPTSFCRYFKKVMKKPFFVFLKEFRIGYACRLLQETDMPIAQVCYESGYEHTGHFYKQFKEVKAGSHELSV